MKLLFSPSSTPPFSAPTLLGLSLSLLLSSDVVTSSVGAAEPFLLAGSIDARREGANRFEKLEEESGGWTEVASNPLPEDNTVFEDRACLEPESTYRWVLTDTSGNGWFCYFSQCSYYELGLNGEIFSSYYENRRSPAFDEKKVLFVTPSDSSSGGWTEVASNPLPEDNTVFEDRACLEPDSTYRWVLTDTFGDGWICYIECAYYELGLNGEIFSSYYETRDYEPPFDEKRVLFVTPSDSSGSAEVVTSGPTTTPSSTPSLSAVPSETPTGSAAPSDSPTVFFCDDESDKPLNIDVKTDDRPYENSWELEEWDDANETWFRIASNGLPYGFDHEFTSYVDNVCLKTGRSYKWTMTDNPNPNYKGNGLGCVAGRGCGKYFVRLDGEIIVSNGKFFSEVVKEIGPIVDCIDEKGLHRVENPRGGRFIEARCKGLRKLIRGSDGAKALEACGATLIDGSGNLWDKCKRSCAAFGAGPCAG
eukprot:CAMPEP_0197196956 /NCGR_PEP_ID=MMETSP1423-20130617/32623_1 /TAXON_ID=476441 /ORGANISM="Pseudo-nitzschia heimii, Strain UNC1101" /LENGTH=476 /DNA_ID=CAMNT_0042650769 /DNA_START=107 /DNA_END=1536 /DNA_ORIENTATION=-